MANFGSLGIGGALADALNTGLAVGNKFSDYQKNRYLESSDQLATLSANEATMYGNRASTIANANTVADLDYMMQQPARTEVQAAQTLQGQFVQGNAEQQAINNAVIMNALNQGVYGAVTPTPIATPEQIGARFREQLQLNGGNPDVSLRGVINGY